MTDQSNDCEACFGTGNDPQVRSRYPTRKIMFKPCPACDGTGKVPRKSIGSREIGDAGL